jgi:hypothetical protein
VDFVVVCASSGAVSDGVALRTITNRFVVVVHAALETETRRYRVLLRRPAVLFRGNTRVH